MGKSTDNLRICFEEAAAFFRDIEGPERIRSNTSKEHTRRNIEKRGRTLR